MSQPVTHTDKLSARGLDVLIIEYFRLAARIDELTEHQAEVLDRIRGYGAGKHLSESGKVVSVNPPNRRFDVTRAAALLSEEDRARCVSITLDPKLVKRFLTQDQLDQCMTPGTGKERVVIGDG